MTFITAAMLFPSDLNGVEFDTVLSEQHSAGLTVTEYPVEVGAPVTDHSFPLPKSLTLTIAHSAKVNFFSAAGRHPARLSEFYTRLIKMEDEAQLFDIITALYPYRNMVVTGIAATRAQGQATIASVTVTCREIVTVNLLAVEDFNQRFNDAVGVAQRAADTTDSGRVNPTEVPEESTEAETVRSTAAYKIWKGRQ